MGPTTPSPTTCSSGSQRSQAGSKAPTAARELFGLYVKTGYINLDGPVNSGVLLLWMSRQACPLEYAIGFGLAATDTIRALIADGSDVEAMLARKGDATIESFVARVAPVVESRQVGAVVTHALMTRHLASAQSEAPVSTAPRRAHRSL